MNTRTYGIKRKHRPFELQEYNPDWKNQFIKYSELIKPTIGENLISIEHMGSTSIEGMFTKPQIDILVVVKNLDKIKKIYDELTLRGFIPRGREYVGIDDEYVTLDSLSGKRLASIHIFQEGNPAISEDRLFRDYLSTHDSDKELYIQTEKNLYSKYKDNYEGYDIGKGEVLKLIKSRAKEWDKLRRNS